MGGWGSKVLNLGDVFDSPVYITFLVIMSSTVKRKNYKKKQLPCLKVLNPGGGSMGSAVQDEVLKNGIFYWCLPLLQIAAV